MADNTPTGFEDPAFDEEISISEFEETEDRYLIDELPHIAHLNTEDNNFEQEQTYGRENKQSIIKV